jgi:hypothetical protein
VLHEETIEYFGSFRASARSQEEMAAAGKILVYIDRFVMNFAMNPGGFIKDGPRFLVAPELRQPFRLQIEHRGQISTPGAVLAQNLRCLRQNVISLFQPAGLQQPASVPVERPGNRLGIGAPGPDNSVFCVGHDRNAFHRAAGVAEKPTEIHLCD